MLTSRTPLITGDEIADAQSSPVGEELSVVHS